MDPLFVTCFVPSYLPAMFGLPAEHGASGVLQILLEDGRVLEVDVEDLPRALIDLRERRAILSDDGCLSLDPLADAHDPDRCLLLLRIGTQGAEVGARTCSQAELDCALDRAWAVIDDGAHAWGDQDLLDALHLPGGMWADHVPSSTAALSP